MAWEPESKALWEAVNERDERRPVGVVVDRDGALLVADDAGNTIWRVTRASGSPRVASGRGAS
jgi:glucose/arabinose dehydrogenase